MNPRTIVMTAAMVTLGFFTSEQSALAESRDVRCFRAKGNLVEVFDPATNSNTGTLSNAGRLDGTVVAEINSGTFATPDPNKVTFSSTMTITTAHGQLKGTGRVYLFDFVTGRGNDVTDIDPNASTGIFAGATGMLYVNIIESVSVHVGPYHQVVTGRICLPRRQEDER